MSIDVDMAEIAALFIEESIEGLDIMEVGLMSLDLGAADSETMNTIFRAAHSIKGGGATFGFTEISGFAHHVETLLDEMRQGQRDVTRDGVDLLLLSVDCIGSMVHGLNDDGPTDTTKADELVVLLKDMLATSTDSTASTSTGGAEPEAASAEQTPVETINIVGFEIDFKPHASVFESCNDPLRMFRELQTLGELAVECSGSELLDLESINPEHCLLGWHLTLMGAASYEEVHDVFAWVEDECDLSIEAIHGSMSEEEIAAAVAEAAAAAQSQIDDETAAKATKAAVAASKKEAPKAAVPPKDGGSIRVNIDKVDALINLVGELVITQSMLSRFNSDVNADAAEAQLQLEDLREGLNLLSRNTRELQESVMAIRLLPISFAFNRFPRLVRDTGNKLGKKIELKLVGEQTELDKTVLEKIGDPLVHLVRNSLDHGFELPEVRLAAGKPETGVLELNAYHEGGNVIIEVIDDGAGINQEKVLSKAREKGLVGEDDHLTSDQINDLIFAAGFSTADAVTDLSGRGVGMDVVRRNIADLGGQVTLESEPGVGSKFTIRLPLTLAILDGQLIRVGEESYIVPLISIVETIQVKSEDVKKVAGGAELFKQREEYLPVLRLHRLFNVEAGSVNIEDGLLVVAEANSQRVGLYVDDLLEQQQVVIKSLEENYRQIPGISGATILGDGHVALIVDVPGMINLYYEQNRSMTRSSTRGRAAWTKV